MPPKFDMQTPKFICASSKTVFCGKFGQQNYIISYLCSNVWQKFNIEFTYNFIVQSLGACTYLHGLQAPEANAKICMHNVHAG